MKEDEKKEIEIKAHAKIKKQLEAEINQLEAQIKALTIHNTELQAKLNQIEEKPIWD
ncbi:MAG: hypothetical protein ACO2Y1_09140 [Flavobacteriaceae bacterium]